MVLKIRNAWNLFFISFVMETASKNETQKKSPNKRLMQKVIQQKYQANGRLLFRTKAHQDAIPKNV